MARIIAFRLLLGVQASFNVILARVYVRLSNFIKVPIFPSTGGKNAQGNY